MAKDKDLADEIVDANDVVWHTSPDGREYFVEDGVVYVLDDDGYAYPEEHPDWDAAPALGDTVVMPSVVVDPPGAADAPSEPEDKDRSADEPAGTAAPGEADGHDVMAEEDDEDSVASAEAEQIEAKSRFHPEGQDTDIVPTVRGERAPGKVFLKITGLESGYGALKVLHGVDLEIRQGETCVLLGLNGAGKTTTAMNICGALSSWDGSIEFNGEDLTNVGVRRCVNKGIVMVPEGRRVFPDLSVGRNLQIGGWTQRKDSDWVESQREQVFDYFPRLREREQQLAGTLSGGEQQMLAIARGLMARPRLLIIDESSMGLAPVIVKDVFDIIHQINADGVTVLLIEQNVGALEVADFGIVMEQGRLVRELRGEELKDRSLVSEILMG